MKDVAMDLARLETMDWASLRSFWRERFASEPPTGRVINILRYEIAWRLQAAAHGDLDAASRRLLRAHAQAAAKRSQPGPFNQAPRGLEAGAKLVREWRGKTYSVKVLANGFEFDGRNYKSLSVIARAITGAHWSGPRFFGLAEAPEG